MSDDTGPPGFDSHRGSRRDAAASGSGQRLRRALFGPPPVRMGYQRLEQRRNGPFGLRSHETSQVAAHFPKEVFAKTVDPNAKAFLSLESPTKSLSGSRNR